MMTLLLFIALGAAIALLGMYVGFTIAFDAIDPKPKKRGTK